MIIFFGAADRERFRPCLYHTVYNSASFTRRRATIQANLETRSWDKPFLNPIRLLRNVSLCLSQAAESSREVHRARDLAERLRLEAAENRYITSKYKLSIVGLWGAEFVGPCV